MGVLLGLFARLPASLIDASATLRSRYPWLKRTTDWMPNLLRNREHQIQLGLGRGLRFNSGNSAAAFVMGNHDMVVQSVMSRLLEPGMTVYDIGANVGFTAVLAARKVESHGKVICFEPLQANAEQ